MKEATLKHFVERLRPVFVGEGRYRGLDSASAALRKRRTLAASALFRKSFFKRHRHLVIDPIAPDRML